MDLPVWRWSVSRPACDAWRVLTWLVTVRDVSPQVRRKFYGVVFASSRIAHPVGELMHYRNAIAHGCLP